MDKNQFQLRYQSALQIVRTLRSRGYEALFAGGVVRDMLMNTEYPGDIDIATNATPQTIASVFHHTIAVGEQFGVMIVVLDTFPFEIATFRSDIGIKDGRHPANVVFTDARTDAQRRDFTINGMFFDPLRDEVIDYVGGQLDIERKIIRAIGEPLLRFDEDYLRMLRAVRFASRFNFSIEQRTWKALQQCHSKIVSISPERIFAELDKILRQQNPHIAIELLDQCKLLEVILPEISGLNGVEQPPEFHPEGDVFVHVIKALSLLELPEQITAWSVLLHDIGKPSTMVISDRIRFNNHDRVGASMAEVVLRRLRAPNQLIEGVTACIENHMNWMNVKRMKLSTLKKFLSRPTIISELELHRVDCLASHGDIENYHFIKEKLGEFKAEQIKPRPFITGKDLLAMGFKPGPLFGKIISEVYDLQLEEQISDHETALAYVREHWRKN